MTTAEALDAIPAIVERRIPITFDYITCPTKRQIAIDNAMYRREELKREIKELIIMHKPQGIGISIDLDELIKKSKDGE